MSDFSRAVNDLLELERKANKGWSDGQMWVVAGGIAAAVPLAGKSFETLTGYGAEKATDWNRSASISSTRMAKYNDDIRDCIEKGLNISNMPDECTMRFVVPGSADSKKVEGFMKFLKDIGFEEGRHFECRDAGNYAEKRISALEAEVQNIDNLLKGENLSAEYITELNKKKTKIVGELGRVQKTTKNTGMVFRIFDPNLTSGYLMSDAAKNIKIGGLGEEAERVSLSNKIKVGDSNALMSWDAKSHGRKRFVSPFMKELSRYYGIPSDCAQTLSQLKYSFKPMGRKAVEGLAELAAGAGKGVNSLTTGVSKGGLIKTGVKIFSRFGVGTFVAYKGLEFLFGDEVNEIHDFTRSSNSASASLSQSDRDKVLKVLNYAVSQGNAGFEDVTPERCKKVKEIYENGKLSGAKVVNFENAALAIYDSPAYPDIKTSTLGRSAEKNITNQDANEGSGMKISTNDYDGY